MYMPHSQIYGISTILSVKTRRDSNQTFVLMRKCRLFSETGIQTFLLSCLVLQSVLWITEPPLWISPFCLILQTLLYFPVYCPEANPSHRALKRLLMTLSLPANSCLQEHGADVQGTGAGCVGSLPLGLRIRVQQQWRGRMGACLLPAGSGMVCES